MKRVLATALFILGSALVVALVFVLIAGAVQERTGMPVTPANLGSALMAPQVVVGGQATGISVFGEGVAKGKPDVARTQVVVEVTATDVQQAQRDAASRMDKVIAKLKELGIAADDIKTSQYSIQPQYNYNQAKDGPTLVGYRVVNAVSVTIRQLDKAGQVLDAVTAAGATRIDGVSFTIADPTALQTQARAAAMKQARAKAEELAKAAGVTLGKVTAISESGGGYRPEYDVSVIRAAAAPETPIVPGELEVNISVQVNYAIQ